MFPISAKTEIPLKACGAAPPRTAIWSSAEVERLQVLSERTPDVLSLERQLYRRFEPAHRGSGIVSHAVEGVAIYVLLLHERLDRVRQLDLAARTARRLLELLEDVRSNHVAADNRQIGRRILRFRLLDQTGQLVQPRIARARNFAGNDAVPTRLFARHFHDRHDRAMSLLVGVDQLADARALPNHDIVGEDHRERLVAHEIPRRQHGVAQAQLFLLADVGHLGEVGDGPYLAQLVDFATRLEELLELEVDFEVILDRPLLAAGDDDDLLDTGLDRLFDAVLDDRLVNEREHLLRLCLGGREEAGAPARRRKDRLAYAHLPSASIGRRGGRLDELVVVAMDAVAQPKSTRLGWHPDRPHDLADL